MYTSMNLIWCDNAKYLRIHNHISSMKVKVRSRTVNFIHVAMDTVAMHTVAMDTVAMDTVAVHTARATDYRHSQIEYYRPNSLRLTN